MGGYTGRSPSDEDRARALEARRVNVRNRNAVVAPIVDELVRQGICSANGLAKALTARGVATPRGKAVWSAAQVQQLLASLRR